MRGHGEKGNGVSGVGGIGAPNIQGVHNFGEVISAMEVKARPNAAVRVSAFASPNEGGRRLRAINCQGGT